MSSHPGWSGGETVSFHKWKWTVLMDLVVSSGGFGWKFLESVFFGFQGIDVELQSFITWVLGKLFAGSRWWKEKKRPTNNERLNKPPFEDSPVHFSLPRCTKLESGDASSICQFGFRVHCESQANPRQLIVCEGWRIRLIQKRKSERNEENVTCAPFGQ